MRFLSCTAAIALSLSSSGIVYSVDADSSSKSISNYQFASEVSWKTPDSPYASYLGNLMAAARPTPDSQLSRLLNNEGIDLTSYSIKFEKCLYIKQYDEEHNDQTVLETQKLVMFRLCPDNGGGTCSSSSCSSNYGEYIIDMDTYLESTLQHKKDEQDAYCEACQSCPAEKDADERRNRRRTTTAVDCATCYSHCKNVKNMEEHGYVDAAEYHRCRRVHKNPKSGLVYYAGAMCDKSGTRIKVGLFTDKRCDNLDADATPEMFIKKHGHNVNLSYYRMKQTFVTDSCVASCASIDEDDEDDEDGDGNDTETKTAKVCQILYEAAGKCETPHAFASGISSQSDYYHVQIANEDAVCEYIANIDSGNYDKMTGETVVKTAKTIIIVGGTKNETVRVTGRQRFSLTVFGIGTVGFVIYAALLRQRLIRFVLMAPVGRGGAMA